MPLLLDQRKRQGRITSFALSVPADASGTIRVKTQISQAELDDPTNSFTLNLEVLRGVWTFDAGIAFAGGPNQGKNGAPTVAPGFIVNLAEYAGQQIRLVFDAPNPINIGVNLDLVSPLG